MNNKVAILQSNYIPWKGYFDLMNQVDDFVIYDCVQYTKNDWRNRNQIKSKNGLQWLTIPVSVKSSSQLINETEVANTVWIDKHMKTIAQTYAKSECYKDYADEVLATYEAAKSLTKLSDINLLFIKWINKKLGITTNIHSSTDFNLEEDRIDRLVSICEQLNANTYLSGPAAKNYLDEQRFTDKSIAIEWMEYSGYPEYPQFGTEFQHGVSVLDLLFHTGSNAANFLERNPCKK
ncbi:WbqC family protein [Candidatus Colwellia aromaticivorans]|uniref:WbqC family protein n=1 Tax=Candidatus Colwellia aromaticivorans TaxID=2267621 RepID=UPI000DF32CBC|nr:WbqC family protein [Candidatus Colwellia aromaticivorans]